MSYKAAPGSLPMWEDERAGSLGRLSEGKAVGREEELYPKGRGHSRLTDKGVTVKSSTPVPAESSPFGSRLRHPW